MFQGILSVLGGIGIFLLGMTLLSEGLKTLSGELLRTLLSRFTRSPLTGALTGFIATICVQSSTVITVMSVGFVGAGLLTFPESLGIIYGANVGSTSTGWLIVVLGLRFSLTPFFLPLVFVGASLRLFGRGRWIVIGNAVAGFSLVFLGISQLQAGMELISPTMTPQSLPGATYLGSVLLVMLGMFVVIIMQSSGASIAATLTALHVGNISLSQACFLVIGMNIGTTATAALASLSGNFNARRVAAAHVFFNVFTAIFAFLSVPVFLRVTGVFAPADGDSHVALQLVIFHTGFNLVGALVALPMTNQFARFVTRIFPPSQRDLARRLEPSLLKHPEVALDAVFATLQEAAETLFNLLRKGLQSVSRHGMNEMVSEDIESAIRDTMRYLNEMRTVDGSATVIDQRSDAMHVMDHLYRLAERSRETERLETIHRTGNLHSYRDQLVELSRVSLARNEVDVSAESTRRFESFYHLLDASLEDYRQSTIAQLESGELTSDETLRRLDAFRWLRRVAFHAWRISYHLGCPRRGNAIFPR